MKTMRVILVFLSLAYIGILVSVSFMPKTPNSDFPRILFALPVMLIVVTALSAYYAQRLGRDGGSWGLGSFLLPFLVPLVLAVMRPYSKKPVQTISQAQPVEHNDARRDRMGFFGRLFQKDAGPKCMSCRKAVEGRDRLMASQSYAVQAGLTQKARAMEENQGYLCKNCGKVYCKVCLGGRVVDPSKGATCPNCGGSFGYLP